MTTDLSALRPSTQDPIPAAIPGAMSAVIVEAGVKLGERLGEELTTDEGNAVWKNATKIARLNPKKS